MMSATISRIALLFLMAGTVIGSLCACGNKGKDGENSVSELAATVGSEEISVRQIDQTLTRANAPGTAFEGGPAIRREILEKLIDKQVAVDQAVDSKLHRLPEVVAQIEAARRDILTRAYVQQIASTLPKPMPEDIKKYYAEHRQLFSERRIFNVHEIVMPATVDMARQILAFSSDGKSIEEIAAWLKNKDIKFVGGSATRAAEQIPMEMLARVHNLNDGQSVVIEAPHAITLLWVASSRLSPIAENAALPLIEQFLSNQRAAEAVAANIKQLRANSKITYFGAFANAERTLLGVDKSKTAIEKSVPVVK